MACYIRFTASPPGETMSPRTRQPTLTPPYDSSLPCPTISTPPPTPPTPHPPPRPFPPIPPPQGAPGHQPDTHHPTSYTRPPAPRPLPQESPPIRPHPGNTPPRVRQRILKRHVIPRHQPLIQAKHT